VKDLIEKGDPYPMSEDEVVASITGVYPVQFVGSDTLKLADPVIADR
jgi:hypothetical protein